MSPLPSIYSFFLLIQGLTSTVSLPCSLSLFHTMSKVAEQHSSGLNSVANITPHGITL
uniref:Uncharacterized protein n=1 Tax=Octopus bimaculoides TaxID=37653 RepID=A0A0L8GV34_OCTBM